MEELKTESTKHLTVDSDWVTFTTTLVALLFLLLATVFTAQRLIRGAPTVTEISWYATPGILMVIWLGVSVKDRAIRWGMSLLLVSIASKIVLRILHVSVAT